MRPLLASCLLAFCAPAQELLWQVYSQQHNYSSVVGSVGDLDGDGWADLLTLCWLNYYLSPNHEALQGLSQRILSGADGSVLADRFTFEPFSIAVVGDFDGDGYQDYAMGWGDGFTGGNDHVEVWSPRRNQQLLLLSTPSGSWPGAVLAGRVDLDGDGRQDLLVGNIRPFTGGVRAYSHTGALLYTIPVGQGTLLDLLGLPDLDADGCSEFVVGGVDHSLGFSRGYVALRSGRTGSLIRVAYDQQLGDFIGRPLCAAGDMDRDGVPDYATGNYWGRGGRSLITVYSGATGAMIREWTATTHGISTTVLGGLDADLDGVPDMIGCSTDYYNGPQQYGRLHVFSSRDQQLLMYTRPQPGASYRSSYGLALASLGVQPGSPYPVFALWDLSAFFNFGRIEVWRCNPAGARVTGTGCSSSGQNSTIGVRRVETPAGDQSRLVLGSAPPNAFAWCAVAPAAASTFAGLNLPIALGPFGFQGCNLYVPGTTSVARTVGSTGFDRGYAEVNLPLPLVPTGGFHAAAQWLVLDPANLGHAMTPRCEFRVQ